LPHLAAQFFLRIPSNQQQDHSSSSCLRPEKFRLYKRLIFAV
jgi:hypothetical protein